MKNKNSNRLGGLSTRILGVGAIGLAGLLGGAEMVLAQTVDDCLAPPHIVTHLRRSIYHRVGASIPEKVALTQSHVLWRQAGNARDVFFVPAEFPRPTPTKKGKLNAKGAVIDFIAVTGRSPGTESIAFYSTLQGIHRSDLPANSGRLLLSPQRLGQAMTELALHDQQRLVWVEDKDIWTAESLGAGEWGPSVSVTHTPGRERNPDTFGPHLVWEDATHGLIKYAMVSNLSRSVAVDEGRNPSVFGNYVVYEKDVDRPLQSCEWPSHSQLWGFGPLNDPSARAFPLMPYGVSGASDCFEPILTAVEVIFACRFQGTPKTILGVIPFRTPSDSQVTEIEELTDGFGYSIKGVRRARGSALLRVAFRDGRGGDALTLIQR